MAHMTNVIVFDNFLVYLLYVIGNNTTDKKSLEYILVNEDGPAHDKTFTIEVRIDNIVYGVGTAHSKKEAEQIAAHDALQKAQNGDFNDWNCF